MRMNLFDSIEIDLTFCRARKAKLVHLVVQEKLVSPVHPEILVFPVTPDPPDHPPM